MSRGFMKKILILSSVLLTGCVGSEEYPEYIPIDISRLSKQEMSAIPTSAFKYLGLHEVEDKQEIIDIVGVDPSVTEWCAAFVNATLSEDNIPGSESVSDHPLMARSFLKWGNKVTKPRFGDIVIFERGESGWKGHVGFFIKEQGEHYIVLGGNQNDMVSQRPYPINKLLAIRRYAPPST